MSVFPGSTPPAGSALTSDTLAVAGHTSLHNNDRDEIRALATKIGTGASTPTSGMLLRGNGVGTSVWGQATLTTDVTGILPIANGGNGTTATTGTGPAVFGTSPSLTTPAIADFTSATHNHQNNAGGGTLSGSALQTNTVAYNNLALGVAVQTVATASTEVATGTTTIPHDDTIPQNTEGTEFITQAITPKSATNTLVIDARIFLSSGTGVRRLIAALFQDATVNALAVGESITETGQSVDVVTVRHIMAAGTTSATTFKIRAGADAAATITFNGDNGARTYGATTKSSIVITEYNS